MTIKISQLGNVAAVQGNVLLPIVSNITGTPTTVKANVDQLQTYILGNAGNIVPSASNIYSIGNSTTWWKDLWLSANTLYIGGVPIGTSGGSLTFGGNVVGTSDLPSYTGNVSAGNIAVGATTVGNTTTAPTFSVEGSTGNISAGNISAGNITSTGDFGAASVSTPTVSSNTVNCGAGGVNFIQGAVDSVTLTNAGTEKGYNRGFVIYPTGGTGTGFAFVIKETTNPESGSGNISVWEVYNPGQGYTAGDELIFDTGYGVPAEFLINAVNDVGTLTAGDSTWSFDPTGDTTIPGNISLPDNTAIYNEDASTAVFTSNIVSDATSIYLTDAGNAAVYASDSVVLETNSDGNISQQWIFNADGSITFPDGGGISPDGGQTTFFGSDGNNAAFGQYDQLNQVYTQPTDVSVQTSTDGNVYYTWSYDTEGNLALPAGEISTLANNDLYIGADSGQAVRIAANSGAKAWNFNSNGSVIFPDNTLQTSAYPGQIYGNTQVNTYLPTYSGNIGGLLVTNPMVVFGNITAGFAFPTASFANVIFTGGGFANGYAQLNIQNVDSVGTQNSADFIATAPNGTDTSHYIDMGINGNNYSSGSWTISGANDGYVYINQGNLTLGTDTQGTTVKVHVGGTLAANVAATFNSSNVIIGGNLIISNSYVPTANNSAGSKGQISYDNSYVYVCIADNNWRRANLAIW
jgi:hypothetical protein